MAVDVSKGGRLMTGTGSGTSGEVTITAVADGYLAPTVTLSAEFDYVIKNDGGFNIEYGKGTWSATTPGLGKFTRAVTESSDGVGVALNLSGGSFNVYMDTPLDLLVKRKGDGTITNEDAVIKGVRVENFAALAALAAPTNNRTLYRVSYGTVQNDGRGGLFEWVAGDTTTQDDHTSDITVNVIKLTASTTGRMFRRGYYLDIKNAADATNHPNNTVGDIGSGNTKQLQIKRTLNTVLHDKKIPETENYVAAYYDTYAAFKAVTSTRWKAGDVIGFRGITGVNDVPVHYGAWDAASTNTDALDILFIRPTDISGSNPGRVAFTEPAAVAVFADGDATPSVKGARNFRLSTAGTTISALDDNIDLQTYTLFPSGSANVTLTHSSSFVMPYGQDFTVYTTAQGGAPVQIRYENGNGYLMGAGGVGEAASILAGQIFS